MQATNIRFGKLFIMHPDAAEKLKDIHRLPDRDAYVGKVSNNDPDMLKGNYDWWGLPDKSMLYVSGPDIDLFRAYHNDRSVKYPPIATDAFYLALSERALSFVNKQEAEGRIVKLIGAPLLTTIAHETRQKLGQWGNSLLTTLQDLNELFQEMRNHRNG